MMAESRTRGFVIAGISLAAVLLGVVGIAELWAGQTSLPNQTERDPNGYLADSDGDLVAQPQKPGTDPIDAIPDDWWVQCHEDPSFWQQHFGCVECSPGYYQGNFCYNAPASVGCGAHEELCHKDGVTITVGVTCPLFPGGPELELSVQLTKSIERCLTCRPDECDIENLRICWPDGRMKLWRCYRRIPVEWEWISGNCKRITKWRTEWYYTTEFLPGSISPVAGCNKINAACYCKHAFNRDCDCDDAAEPADGTNPAHNIALDDTEEFGTITIEVFQVIDRLPHEPPAVAIEDFNAQETAVLRSILEHTKQRMEYHAAMAVALVFENGDTVSGMFETIESLVSLQYEWTQTSVVSLDLNGNGTVDQSDLQLLLDAVQKSRHGALYSTRFDLNGDGLICELDIEVFENIASSH